MKKQQLWMTIPVTTAVILALAGCGGLIRRLHHQRIILLQRQRLVNRLRPEVVVRRHRDRRCTTTRPLQVNPV
ncbi:hypothetical protein C0Q44_22185 [Paenibacillus sp. PCH8]|nr:hypothetical protein C0Q44_22185 [Paenibacillus sp. PCH8]